MMTDQRYAGSEAHRITFRIWAMTMPPEIGK
jgi:hypothetical protein